jgi:hypothetical protein
VDRIQLLAIATSVVLLVTVIDLVRRRKLVEEYSLLWIAAAVLLLVLSVWRGLLDAAAARLGVFYPPSLLLMSLVVIVFGGLLWLSVVLSRQRRQIERLTEETAVLGAEVRELRTQPDAPPQRDRPSVRPDPKRPRR